MATPRLADPAQLARCAPRLLRSHATISGSSAIDDRINRRNRGIGTSCGRPCGVMPARLFRRGAAGDTCSPSSMAWQWTPGYIASDNGRTARQARRDSRKLSGERQRISPAGKCGAGTSRSGFVWLTAALIDRVRGMDVCAASEVCQQHDGTEPLRARALALPATHRAGVNRPPRARRRTDPRLNPAGHAGGGARRLRKRSRKSGRWAQDFVAVLAQGRAGFESAGRRSRSATPTITRLRTSRLPAPSPAGTAAILTDRKRAIRDTVGMREPENLGPHACRFRQHQRQSGQMLAGRSQPRLALNLPDGGNAAVTSPVYRSARAQEPPAPSPVVSGVIRAGARGADAEMPVARYFMSVGGVGLFRAAVRFARCSSAEDCPAADTNRIPCGHRRSLSITDPYLGP